MSSRGYSEYMDRFAAPFGLTRRPNLFQGIRLSAYAAVIVSSIVVLGIAAHFGTIFLPNLHFDMVVFALIVPTVTLVILFIVMLRSQPRIDIFALFILAALWLSLGAYATDFIGHVECFALGNQRTPTKNGGSTSARGYCYELKVIEAFSWANFAILTLAFIVLLMLIIRVLAHGRQTIWRESISELPWFGQYGQPGQPIYAAGYAYGGQPYYQAQPNYGYGGYAPNIHMAPPGQSMLVQPHPGGPPTITPIPNGPMMPPSSYAA
ncbi:hypothetical protein EXIGLDRAFT_716047 [Exidia glandulosa HHB12029]|uniref:MARVEL domain-containing protein n=1 Tax=Exidia glandulosa HHB12029 TaxID=1314781 RepID=A0A166BU18_EXIGL|nr:hypothetical protein EXIGLDRAFT_716047 [Exidia glandulosa HHB12029]